MPLASICSSGRQGALRCSRYALAALGGGGWSTQQSNGRGVGEVGAALRARSAMRSLLGLCPRRTRRGLVGAGGKLGLCPWPVSAAAAGREHYAACATRLRRLAGEGGLHNNQMVRDSERSGWQTN